MPLFFFPASSVHLFDRFDLLCKGRYFSIHKSSYHTMKMSGNCTVLHRCAQNENSVPRFELLLMGEITA